MIPVYQDIFFESDRGYGEQRGNCFSAVLASLLELPLRAVPNFVEIDVAGGPNWWWLFHNYIRSFYDDRKIVNCFVRSPPANQYYAVGGLSTQATEEHPIHHICVYYNGKMVHDPNPKGRGLLTEETCWYIDRS